MSIELKIKDALSAIVGDVESEIYGGEALEYAVFSYAEIPDDFADDAPQAIRYAVCVHWFLPNLENPLHKKREIATALLHAGFTYPGIVNASDEDGQHFVFECEYAEGMNG